MATYETIIGLAIIHKGPTSPRAVSVPRYTITYLTADAVGGGEGV